MEGEIVPAEEPDSESERQLVLVVARLSNLGAVGVRCWEERSEWGVSAKGSSALALRIKGGEYLQKC